MKVFQRLAHAFKAEGVDATFGMMGDGNMFWLHEMHKLGIKVHEVRHEGAGLGMADGYARTSRRVGVATATCGPGTSQLATAFVTAARAESPLVAFCGEYPVGDPEYSQRLDQSAFAHGCEAAFVRMGAADQADEAVRKAFYIAKTESRPVLLSVPMDLQQEQWEDDDPYVPSADADVPQSIQAGQQQIPAQSVSVPRGIHRDHIHLAFRGRGCLGPVKTDHVVTVPRRLHGRREQQQPGRVEPWLAHSRAQIRATPGTLVRQLDERAGVHPQQGCVVHVAPITTDGEPRRCRTGRRQPRHLPGQQQQRPYHHQASSSTHRHRHKPRH